MQLTQNSLRSENASIPNATIVAVVVAFDRNDTSTALSFTANSEAFVTRDPTLLHDARGTGVRVGWCLHAAKQGERGREGGREGGREQRVIYVWGMIVRPTVEPARGVVSPQRHPHHGQATIHTETQPFGGKGNMQTSLFISLLFLKRILEIRVNSINCKDKNMASDHASCVTVLTGFLEKEGCIPKYVYLTLSTTSLPNRRRSRICGETLSGTRINAHLFSFSEMVRTAPATRLERPDRHAGRREPNAQARVQAVRQEAMVAHTYIYIQIDTIECGQSGSINYALRGTLCS